MVRLVALKTALQGRGNLRGSGSHSCVSCSIHAGTTEHMENYHKYLWVCRTLLPMGLHCQRPLFIEERSPQGPWAPSPAADPSVLPDGPLYTAGASNSALPQKRTRQTKMLLHCSVISRLVPQDSCLRTHASRLVSQDSLPVPLCCKDRLGIILYHIVSFILQLSLHHKIKIW